MPENFTIVIPVLNEEENLKRILPLLKTHKVVIVDDDSSDHSQEIASAYKNVTFVKRIGKTGVVSAYIEGLKRCKTRYAVVMDADLSHDPKYIRDMVKFASKSSSDLVLGSRYQFGGKTQDTRFRILISKAANFMFRLSFYSSIKDATSGFRVYSRRAYIFVAGQKDLAEDYTGQIDIVMRLIKASFKCSEFPIKFFPRTVGSSKLKLRNIMHFFLFVLLEGNLLKYALVGLSGILVNEGLLFLLHTYNVYIAELIAIEASVVTNFLFNERWTFSQRKLDKSTAKLLRRLATANVFLIAGLVSNYVIFLALYSLGVYYLIANFIAIILAFVFNYVVSSIFVWGENPVMSRADRQ